MWDKNLHHYVINSQSAVVSPFKLYDAAKSNRSFVQKLALQTKLAVHKGCVNTISWSDCGRYILSGSDDQHLVVTDGYSYEITANVQTGHRANIFSAKFLPNTNNHHVVSCSGDGVIIFTDLELPETSLYNVFNCHYGTAYEVTTVPNDSHGFLSCGEDGTVRWFDLRTKTHCCQSDCKDDILINCRHAVTALAVNHLTPYLLAVGCADSNVRIFDRRMLGTRALGNFAGSSIQSVVTRFTVPEFENKNHRITSLCYSPDGREMLVSYSSDFIYLFDTNDDGKSAPKVLSPVPTGATKKVDKPPMKRLRVRGDWSDTGPNARPELERVDGSTVESVTTPDEVPSIEEPRQARPANLMQRMSDVLNRIFNSPVGSSRRQRDIPERSEGADFSRQEASEVREESVADKDGGTSSQHLTPILRKKENDCDRKTKKHVHVEEPPKEDCLPSCSSSIAVDSDPLSESSNDESTDSESRPGSKTFSNSLQNLERELVTRRDEILQRSMREPVVNLQYSGQGVNNGIITVESGSLGSPSSSTSSFASNPGYLSASSDRPASGLSDSSLVVNGSISPLPGMHSVVAGSDVDGNDNAVMMEIPPWEDPEEHTLSTTDDDTVEEESDGRRSRRGMHEDDEGEHSDGSEVERRAKTPGRNPRELLLRSFDDVLKNFREEREQEKAQLAKVTMPQIKQTFTGHRNARTMIKEATFWGNDFIMSGSDCGHIFVWDRYTADLVMLLEADHHVVNCLQPHPFDPILASSGIDYDIKLWSPLGEADFDDEKAREIVQRNEVMLEETKDTITVPASFMIRMLNSLNQIRANRRSSRSRDGDGGSEEGNVPA